MMRSILRGGAAGAAGTTALDAVTYADMAFRGREASEVPEQVVDRLSEQLRWHVSTAGGGRENRLTGLAALSGIAVGSGVGVVVSLSRRAGLRLPMLVGGLLTGALAMAASDLPVARLGVSDPRTWSKADWASDALPHLAYGVVTYGLVTAWDGRR